MAASAPVIRVRGLVKAWRDGDHQRRVLDSLDFDAPAGDSVAVWGPSGTGKSTLLNILAGLLQPDAGTVVVHPRGLATGIDVAGLDAAQATRYRRRHVGYVFQFFNLVPTLTVAENIRLPLALNGLEDQWPRARDRLGRLGLADRLDAFPETLSGGERQRVAIARALAHEPSIVLADEPTGNLDAANTDAVAALLFETVREAGATLLLATHDAALAARARQRIDLTRPA